MATTKQTNRRRQSGKNRSSRQSTRLIKPGQAKIHDLQNDEKSKIGNLIRKVIELDNEVKTKEKESCAEKQNLNKKVNILTKQNKDIIKQHVTLRSKFQQSLQLLQNYQLKLNLLHRNKIENDKKVDTISELEKQIDQLKSQLLEMHKKENEYRLKHLHYKQQNQNQMQYHNYLHSHPHAHSDHPCCHGLSHTQGYNKPYPQQHLPAHMDTQTQYHSTQLPTIPTIITNPRTMSTTSEPLCHMIPPRPQPYPPYQQYPQYPSHATYGSDMNDIMTTRHVQLSTHNTNTNHNNDSNINNNNNGNMNMANFAIHNQQYEQPNFRKQERSEAHQNRAVREKEKEKQKGTKIIGKGDRIPSFKKFIESRETTLSDSDDESTDNNTNRKGGSIKRKRVDSPSMIVRRCSVCGDSLNPTITNSSGSGTCTTTTGSTSSCSSCATHLSYYTMSPYYTNLNKNSNKTNDDKNENMFSIASNVASKGTSDNENEFEYDIEREIENAMKNKDLNGDSNINNGNDSPDWASSPIMVANAKQKQSYLITNINNAKYQNLMKINANDRKRQIQRLLEMENTKSTQTGTAVGKNRKYNAQMRHVQSSVPLLHNPSLMVNVNKQKDLQKSQSYSHMLNVDGDDNEAASHCGSNETDRLSNYDDLDLTNLEVKLCNENEDTDDEDNSDRQEEIQLIDQLNDNGMQNRDYLFNSPTLP